MALCSVLTINITQLEEAIEQRVRAQPTEVNMVMWMGRTALELVGQAGLGYSFDKLTEETPDELGDALKSFMSVPPLLPPLLSLLPCLLFLFLLIYADATAGQR